MTRHSFSRRIDQSGEARKMGNTAGWAFRQLEDGKTNVRLQWRAGTPRNFALLPRPDATRANFHSRLHRPQLLAVASS